MRGVNWFGMGCWGRCNVGVGGRGSVGGKGGRRSGRGRGETMSMDWGSSVLVRVNWRVRLRVREWSVEHERKGEFVVGGCVC